MDLADRNNLIKLKAELLCLGINVSPQDVDPYFLEDSFIDGSQVLLPSGDVVNVAVNEKFVKKYSPFQLVREDGCWKILKKGKEVCSCTPLLMPDWVNYKVAPNLKIGDFIRPHSNNILFVTSIKECVFSRIGEKCKFCTFDGKSIYDFDIIQKGFERIFFEEDGKYEEIAIGGATPNLRDFGVEYYCKLARMIRKLNPEIRISLEIIPPPDLNLLQEIHSSGVDSIIMNLEIFDDAKRKETCLGKEKIPKEHYFKSWEKALEIFGENKVSSVLIVGLEGKKTTILGARKMLEIGVLPTLIPFRPYDNCALNNLLPVDPRYYLSIYYEVLASSTCISKLNPILQDGCLHCGGCSLERLLLRILLPIKK